VNTWPKPEHAIFFVHELLGNQNGKTRRRGFRQSNVTDFERK